MEKLELNERYYRDVTVNGEILGKWVNLVRIAKYDSKENLIYEAEDYSEKWLENNEYGHIIFEKRDNGQEFSWKRKYDKNGNLVWFERSDGLERWFEYDSKGNVIHRTDSEGNEVFIEYDSNGNIIHIDDNNKPEIWFEYNSKNLKVHKKDSNDYEEWFEYDEKGNMICCKNSYDEEKFCEYDDKGNLIHRVNFDGSDVWFEYEFYEDGKKKAIYTFVKI